MHRAFSGLRVRDLMIPAPSTIGPGADDRRADGRRRLDRSRQDAYPVVDAGRVVGLLPFRVIADVPRSEWDARTVGERMLPLPVVPVLSGDDSLEQALAALSRGSGPRTGRRRWAGVRCDLARRLRARSSPRSPGR